MWRLLSLLVASILLTACAQTMSSTDSGFALRQESNKHAELILQEMSLPALQRQLYKHREQCPIVFEFTMDPRQVHYATVRYGLAEHTALKEQALIDLKAFSNGKMEVVGYSYYPRQAYLIKAFLEAIEHPERCPEPN